MITLLLMAGMFASSGTYLSRLIWQKRVLLVHIPSDSTQWNQQNALWKQHEVGLKERDLIIGRIEGDVVKWPDYQEGAQVYLEQFSISKSSFSVLLIGKDGTEKLRTAGVLSIDKLFGTIDQMPMRRAEMRQPKGKLTYAKICLGIFTGKRIAYLWVKRFIHKFEL